MKKTIKRFSQAEKANAFSSALHPKTAALVGGVNGSKLAKALKSVNNPIKMVGSSKV